MNYILGLLFEYKRYKHDLVIRIYADDFLIDELRLNKDIELKEVDFAEAERIISAKVPTLETYSKSFIPKKIFLFEINEKYLRRNLTIEITNNNNDYTNGFMKNYSYVSWHKIFLIPACLTNDENWTKLCRFHDTNRKNNRYPWFPSIQDVRITSTNPWTEYLLHHKRGGSFTIQIPLYTKHNVAHLGRKLENGRIKINWAIFRILHIFDKLNISA